ncbi:universal stress protein [Nonomuraea harbinensis]|uniref:Universal stress protein n=1 Tax=Nonomuraea harbinensis TaxID=1286938 RepID=A0ABW1BP03_9ACTN|nr:universal stress protein [Nonomuraea harbinensis]
MIVVGVDGSVTSRAAVEWAAGDAFRMREPLRLVYAVDRAPYQITRFPAGVAPDALQRAGQKALAEAVALVHERQPTVEVTAETVEGSPAGVLRELDGSAVEIVVGSRGLGGLSGALLGSVSTHVAGHAHRPVVVVRGERFAPRGEVVVGVDDSHECEAALGYAFEQARLRGARLRALHAWQLPVHAFAPEVSYDLDEIGEARRQAVSDRLAAFREKYPQVDVVEDVRSGRPVEELADASAGADLVVVGSHGRGAVASALLGSVSRGVLHQARCPVAVVRS